MAEVSNELIYKLMLDIQAEQKALRANIEASFADTRAEQDALSAKVGTIASAMVSINKQLDDLTTSSRLIAVAVDEHTHRLDGVGTRLERIEKKLDLTHA
jgi:chromosome segregation ATPase